MKLPPIPWSFLFAAALLCTAIAAAYRFMGFPTWAVAFALVSAVVLFYAAFRVKDEVRAESVFEYGRCTGRLARRHKISGEVFYLLKPSESGDQYDLTEPRWFLLHPSYWDTFTSGPAASARTNSAPWRPPQVRSESVHTG